MISIVGRPKFSNNYRQYIPTFTSHEKAGDTDIVGKAEYYAKNSVSRFHLGHCSKSELDNMEGIQSGLKTFEGLTLTEIRFLFNNLSTIALVRGCRNNCSHCYEDARKPFSKSDLKKDENLINYMDFEDYRQFIEDTVELKRRLNMDLSKPSYIAFFLDSDPMFYSGVDKFGKNRDISDVLSVFLSKDLNYKVQFDTAGWNVKDETRNHIAQKISSIVAKNPRKVQVCVSINPFHSILEKSYENVKCGNKEKAKKLKEIYINRMANTIYQLAPCVKSDSLYYIVNALPSDSGIDYSKNPRGGDIFVNDILIPILLKVGDLCEENKNGYSSDIINTLCSKAYMSSHTTIRAISSGGRASKNYSNLRSGINNLFVKNKIIDANGNIYADSDGNDKYATELKLNFNNKDKITLPIERLSNLRTYTKDEIASIYKEYDKKDILYIDDMEIYWG